MGTRCGERLWVCGEGADPLPSYGGGAGEEAARGEAHGLCQHECSSRTPWEQSPEVRKILSLLYRVIKKWISYASWFNILYWIFCFNNFGFLLVLFIFLIFIFLYYVVIAFYIIMKIYSNFSVPAVHLYRQLYNSWSLITKISKDTDQNAKYFCRIFLIIIIFSQS